MSLVIHRPLNEIPTMITILTLSVFLTGFSLMRTRMNGSFVLFAGVLLAVGGCQHPKISATRSADDVDHLLQPGLYVPTTRSQDSPAGIKVPLLLAPAWGGGKPTYRIMLDGSYIAEYKSNTSASDYLTIIGTPRPIATLSLPRKDGQWIILGHEVPWFWSGNETPEITTAGVSLTSPDRHTANYKIIFGGAKRNLEKRLPELNW